MCGTYSDQINHSVLELDVVPHFMQVPHSEVIERVSSILKDNGFCPTSEWIEIGNLSPYEDVLNSAIDMGQRQRRRRHRHGAAAASTTTLTRAAAASTTTSTWGYCGVDDEIDTEQCCLKLHY